MRDSRKRLFFCTSDDYAKLTGGSVYNHSVVKQLRKRGWRVSWLKVGSKFPKPSAATRTKAVAQIKAAAAKAPVIVDGLVLGCLPEIAGERVRGLIALIHHPLAFETGWSDRERRHFVRNERASLSAADIVVVTSNSTKETLYRHYGVPRGRTIVATPGVEKPPSRKTRKPGDRVAMLSVGAIVPRKRHALIVEALGRIDDRNWTLTIVGDLKRNPAAVKNLRRAIDRNKVHRNVTIAGAVSDARLRSLYAASTIFVLVPHHEGYGMAYAEALTHGLAIVGASAGGTADVLSKDCALIVDPVNRRSVAEGLHALLRDPSLCSRLAAAARRRARSLPSWKKTAIQIEKAIARTMRDRAGDRA